MRVFIETLGCRVNQLESEALLESFLDSGFTLSMGDGQEVAIVNTCTVTSKAEQKARREIRRFIKNSDAIIVTGCYADTEREEIESLSDKIVVFTIEKKSSIKELPKWIEKNASEGMSILESIKSFNHDGLGRFDFNPKHFEFHSRAYLKVQDGCDNQCGYCRTTIARGPSVSIEPDEAIKRALELERRGFHEITLTGVNLANYSYNGITLGGLLKKLLERLGEDVRIRLSSLEPQNINSTLFEAISDFRVQSYFHLPIQSGSERVLTLVGRDYTPQRLKEIVAALREVKDDPFISADIIAGLPGETEEEFLKTYTLIRELDLSYMHVFPYSPRKGTRLYSVKHPEERVRDDRAERLRSLSKELNRRYTERQVGRVLELIVEDSHMATSSNYLKCEVVGESVLRSGDFIKGRLISSNPLRVSLLS